MEDKTVEVIVNSTQAEGVPAEQALIENKGNILKGKLYSHLEEIKFDFWIDTVEKLEYDKPIIEGRFFLEHKGPFFFLTMIFDTKSQKYLILQHEDFLMLYADTEKAPKWDGLFGANVYLYFLSNYTVTADSELTEGGRTYSAGNLLDYELDSPWVEGEDGPGIGSKLYISSELPIKELVISNGYFSQKTELYAKNNRVKSLRVSNAKDPTQAVVFDLEDTVQPRSLELGFTSESLVLEILDVYPGSAYDDTCINFILPKTKNY